MRSIPVLPIIALFSSLGPARADFAMLPPESTTSDPPAVIEAPSTADPSISKTVKPVEKRRDGHTPKTISARGFGKKVPLAFAVRQIVPAPVKVSFGPGTDTAALVDWQGGRQWPVVLREAVRPLGFRVTVRDNAVSIAR
ncbi:hypothetical protein [Methylocystis sp.]|uniref:hypothetical protein n=1 Tax=Methylocystis sp. TaxID=1911079 RepID=UPI0025FA5CC6|nr:hypothetical protein [Methylocystis sp.]